MNRKLLIVITAFAVFSLCFRPDTQVAEKQDNMSIKDTVLSEDELGYRKTSLFDEENVELILTKYTDVAAGNSINIERSFENAPPLIPHNIKDFVPVTKDDNMCLMCHMPEDDIEAMEATPIPISHFTEYRPELIIENGVYILKTKGIEIVQKDLEKSLSNARYNCTQCHVQQAEITIVLENFFIPEFRDTLGKKRSNLNKVISEGIR